MNVVITIALAFYFLGSFFRLEGIDNPGKLVGTILRIALAIVSIIFVWLR